MTWIRNTTLVSFKQTMPNLFFDLPQELQLQILVINLMSDLPDNFLLARKELFVKNEKLQTLKVVDMWGINAFDFKMCSLSDSIKINSPYHRFIRRLDKPLNSVEPRHREYLGWNEVGFYDHYQEEHARYATPIDEVYYEVIDWKSSFKQDNGRFPTKRRDALLLSPVVNKIIGQMRVNKLADFLTSKVGKKGLQQSCDDNGIKWFNSWTIKRLKKELMAI